MASPGNRPLMVGKWVFIIALVAAFIVGFLPHTATSNDSLTKLSGFFVLVAIVVGIPWWIRDARARRRQAEPES